MQGWLSSSLDTSRVRVGMLSWGLHFRPAEYNSASLTRSTGAVGALIASEALSYGANLWRGKLKMIWLGSKRLTARLSHKELFWGGQKPKGKKLFLHHAQIPVLLLWNRNLQPCRIATLQDPRQCHPRSWLVRLLSLWAATATGYLFSFKRAATVGHTLLQRATAKCTNQKRSISRWTNSKPC